MNLNVTIINGYHHKNCTRLLSLQNMSHGRLYSLCDAHPPQMMWKTFKNYEENVHKYEGNVHKDVENVHKYVENVHKYVEMFTSMRKAFTSMRKAGTAAQHVEDVRLRAMAETFKTFKTI